MIPRLLHRIWFGGPMPDEFVKYGVKWRALHPEWTIVDWPGEQALPELSWVYDFAEQFAPGDHLRFQADVLRLAILWTYGGVYVDTDVEPLRPIDELLEGVECFASWSPNRGKGGERLLTNCVMGAVPRHLFIGRCIEGLGDAVRKYAGRTVVQMVGPWHLSRTYALDQTGVTVFDEHIFSPQNNKQRNRGEVPDLSRSYGWHKWANTRKAK